MASSYWPRAGALALLLLAAVLSPLAAKPTAPAAVLQLTSPDREQTWPWGNLLRSSWRRDGDVLALVLTYSNEMLSDRNDPRREEDLQFDFPTARYDAARSGFFVRAQGKSPVPVLVAARSRGFVKSVVLVPNAFAVVERHGADLRVTLVVDRPGRRFPEGLVEADRAAPYTLQSLLDR